jgi:DNA-binding transcriptional ArsR family regulator
MQELAEVMVMDRSTLGHNLRPLERDHLVELGTNASDRRSRLVFLTGRGRRKPLPHRHGRRACCGVRFRPLSAQPLGPRRQAGGHRADCGFPCFRRLTLDQWRGALRNRQSDLKCLLRMRSMRSICQVNAVSGYPLIPP